MQDISRRQFVGGLIALPIAHSLPAFAADTELTGLIDEPTRTAIAAYLEHHRKPSGGYGWISRTNAHITPTFAVVASYRLLGLPVPDMAAVAAFVQSHNPFPPGLGQQPLYRLNFEQAQVLLWLGEKPDNAKAAEWTKPFVYNTYYEQNHNPTLQHQAMAVRVRSLLDVQSKDDLAAWQEYFLARLRPNGTFNNTPAADGSDGHIVNTLWGSWTMADLGAARQLAADTVAWVQNCQLPSGGFTWSPLPQLGGVENVIYTWAAVSLLHSAGAVPKNKAACVRWLREQFTSDKGFRDRPGAKVNLTATYYALDALRILRAPLHGEPHRTRAVPSTQLPPGLRIFSAQIEAPGQGSPSEAVALAEALGIHIWTAKNSPPDWIAEAQRIADTRRSGVQFARGDEEYGTYTKVAGFGTYSHLDDLVAPATAELGPYPPEKNTPHDWLEFCDTRIHKVRQANGRMVWQFNENEELSRILLDQAVETGSYSAISGFHFGIGDFLELEPFLMSWEDRLTMIGLQDAHGGESWWWAAQLEGFRTLYLAREPGWEGFVQAMDRKWMLAARRDATTQFALQWTGALPEVRDFIATHESEWSWWDVNSQKRKRPLAVLTVLRPGMKFEEGVPETGVSVRVRLRFAAGKNPSRAMQGEAETELISMRIDGRNVDPRSVVNPHDRYLIYEIPDDSAKQAAIVVRDLSTMEEQTISANIT